MIRWLIPWLFLLAGCAASPWGNQLDVRDVDAGFLPGAFARIGETLREEERRGEIPGGALAIWSGRRLVYTNAFGRTLPGEKKDVGPPTLFDVASLSKAMAGGPAAVILLEQANTAGEEDAVLLLSGHKSGLIDDEVFPEIRRRIEEGVSAEALEAWLDCELDGPHVYTYSNSGYVLLALRARAVVSEKILRESFWQPMGLESLLYRQYSGTRADFAASGHTADGGWVVGTPFDPVADAMLEKGIALPLHSGLFATAEGVARFGGALLAEAESERIRKLQTLLLGGPYQQDVDVYTTPGGLASPVRGPFAPEGSPPGRVYMLTGFTGCLLWLDTQTGMAVGLVTNASANDALDRWDVFAQNVIREVIQGAR